MGALDRVLTALGDRVKLRRQDGFQAQCPAHEDGRASLAGKVGDKGMMLRCHAGCATEDVVKALKLSMGDLFDEPLRKRDFKIVATYPYRDEAGKLLYEVVRLDPKDFRQRRPNGTGWSWGLGDVRQVPYCLPQLVRSGDRGVFIPEGEKDVDRLMGLGLIATTNSGGAGKWRAEFSQYLKGRNVFVLPDNDEPGRKHARSVADSLAGTAASCRIIELPGLSPKGDVSDWLMAGGTKEQLLKLARAPQLSVKERLARLAKELEEIGRLV